MKDVSGLIDLLQDGEIYCNALLRRFPDLPALLSVSRQITYLLSLATGQSTDRSLLKTINIGVLAAREIEPLTEDGAEILYKIASKIREP